MTFSTSHFPQLKNIVGDPLSLVFSTTGKMLESTPRGTTFTLSSGDISNILEYNFLSPMRADKYFV